MSVDLDKVVFSSNYNAYKNNGILTSGSISFPTVLTAGQALTVSVTLTLDVAPVFSEFIAYFTEFTDLLQYGVGVYGNPQWYPGIISASNDIGIWVTTAPHINPIQALINPIINGNVITVQGLVTNPYSSTVNLAALTVPFAFTSYTLAN